MTDHRAEDDSGDHQIGSDCDHDWCLWHDSEVHDGKEVRWCRECEVIQLREPKEDILTDGGTESDDTVDRDPGGNPKECPDCGGRSRKQRFYVHTEPPEVSIVMKCEQCGCRATYAYRAEPTLEVAS